MKQEEEDDFWGGPTFRQALESNRQVERQKFESGWRRNVLVTMVLLLLLLSVVWIVLR